MKKAISFFLLYSLILSGIYAQSGLIKGNILDETGLPLIGATISANASGTTTDLDGYYELSLFPGTYDIEITYVGYEKIVQYIELADGEEITLEATLKSSNVLLETATVTSSKYEIRIAESISSIEVIKPELIENTNSATVDEVLDKVPGVQIVDDQANIRGGSGWSFGAGSRVMVLMDDIPILQADAGLAQWDDIPVENISQIEVVKGASSALYGSSALNGIINFRTSYATSEPTTKLSLFTNLYYSPKDKRKKWWTGTPFNTGMSFLHKQKFDKLDFVLGGYYFNQSEDHTYAEQRFRRKARMNTNIRYRLTDRLSFGLTANVNDGTSSSYFLWQDALAGAYKPFPGAISTAKNLRYTVDPFVTYFDSKNNKHKLQTRYYYINNENNMNQSNASQTYYGEYQFQRRFDDYDLNLTTGIAGTWFTSDSDLFSDTLIQSRNYASYLQLDKKMFDKLNLSLGLRYELNRQLTPEEFQGIKIPGGILEEGKFIYRYGLNYEVAEFTFLRASYGQGYRYPTITERFIQTSFSAFSIFPNPLLESETGWSSEIGIKQGFKLFNFEGFLDIATFWSEYNNMMEFTFVTMDGNIGFQSQNVGDTQIKGYEVSVMGQSKIFDIPIRVYGGYTYIDPVYQNFTDEIKTSSSDTTNVLKYRNKHTLTLDVEAEWKGILLGTSIRGSSPVEAIDGILNSFAQIGKYRDLNNNGFKRWDARIAYRFETFKLTAVVNNILNEEYTERPAILEPPRNMGLRVDFNL